MVFLSIMQVFHAMRLDNISLKIITSPTGCQLSTRWLILELLLSSAVLRILLNIVLISITGPQERTISPMSALSQELWLHLLLKLSSTLNQHTLHQLSWCNGQTSLLANQEKYLLFNLDDNYLFRT